MKRLTVLNALAACALLASVGCQSGSDDPAPVDNRQKIAGYTVTATTSGVIDTGVSQTTYTMEKPDTSVVASGTQTRVGIKDNKLYVLDVKPSANPDLRICVGLPSGKVKGLATTSAMAATIEANSAKTVVGGVNGDFFDIYGGGAVGYTMRDGRWLSTCEYAVEDLSTANNYKYPGWAFGIKADGSAVIGMPQVAITFDSFTGAVQDNDDVAVNVLNQLRADAVAGSYSGTNPANASGPAAVLATRADNLIVLYTPDYAAATPTTATTSCEVVFSTGTQTLTSDGTVTGTVTAIDTDGAAELADGTMVLSGYGAGASALAGIAVGDTITVAVSVNDEWDDVVDCLGGGRHDGGPLLVKNGVAETLKTGIADYSSNGGNWDLNNPRTAVGIRADGSYFFYVVDGRWANTSLGATIPEMIQIAIDLGAVTAVNLDGGGSSTLITASGTEGVFNTINHPAYGSERSDGNAVFVVK